LKGWKKGTHLDVSTSLYVQSNWLNREGYK